MTSSWLQFTGLCLDMLGFFIIVREWMLAMRWQHDENIFASAESLVAYKDRCRAKDKSLLNCNDLRRYERHVVKNLTSLLARTELGVPLVPETLETVSDIEDLASAYRGGRAYLERSAMKAREAWFWSGAFLVMLGFLLQALGTLPFNFLR